MKVPVHAPGVRNGATGTAWRGMLPPPGKHWQFPPKTLDEMDARGEIFWSANGNPRRKVYLDGSPGVGVQDIWMDFRDAHNQNIRITGYPTEKNPDLLSRIIRASSNPGNLVLDCYCGSGTTLAVASQLGRQWIGVDSSPEAIRTTLRRFAVGTEPMGDFAGQRQPQAETRCRKMPPQQSLFDEINDEAEPPSNRQHRPILDFTLLAEPRLAGDISRILQDWETLLAQKRGPRPEDETCQPAETAGTWSAACRATSRVRRGITAFQSPSSPLSPRLIRGIIVPSLSFQGFCPFSDGNPT